MGNVKMQCIDIHDGGENSIHCPLCGIKIARGSSEEDRDEWIVGKCEHLLFAAVDGIAFEYRSRKVRWRRPSGNDQKTKRARRHLPKHSVSDLVPIVEIPDAFMFQSIMSHPSQPDVYVGFAPTR